MKQIYFTVGPSQVYPTVPRAIKKALDLHVASLSHRSAWFQQLFFDTQKMLRKLLGIPKNHRIFFLSSGTEAMERVIENTVEKYSTHFVNGTFSERFYQIAQMLGKETTLIEVKTGTSFDFKKVKIPKNCELICFTHNETSSGVMIDLNEVYQIKKEYPKALIALDIVSSVPYANVDFSQIDCVFFSVQKGTGLPAGLAVLTVSP